MRMLRKRMWNTLRNTGGAYGMILNITNIFFQYGAITKPYSDAHRNVNIVYSACTIVSLFLYWLSRYKNNSSYIFPAYLVVAMRNTVRLVDLENTRFYMSEIQWFELCIQQVMTSLMFFALFITFFGMFKKQIIFTVVYGIVIFISFIHALLHFNN